MSFWETLGGRALIEGTLPRIAKSLEKLNDNLDRIHERNEKEFNELKERLRAVDPAWKDEMTPAQLASTGVREDALEAFVHQLMRTIDDHELADYFDHDFLVKVREVAQYEYRPDPESGDQRLVQRIRDILWPNGNTDHEWDSDTMAAVAEALQDEGVGPQQLWDNDLIQFARLLCEIYATQINFNFKAVQESMDLPAERVEELFDRAHSVWKEAKKNL